MNFEPALFAARYPYQAAERNGHLSLRLNAMVIGARGARFGVQRACLTIAFKHAVSVAEHVR